MTENRAPLSRPAKKGRKSNSAEMIENIAREFQQNQGKAMRENMNYVWMNMETDTSGQVADTLAQMMKSGSTRKALAQAMAEGSPVGDHGRMLKVACFKALETGQIDRLLRMCTGEICTVEALAEQTRNSKLSYLCFGLGVSQGRTLPVVPSTLKWEEPLFAYLAIHYRRLGR